MMGCAVRTEIYVPECDRKQTIKSKKRRGVKLEAQRLDGD